MTAFLFRQVCSDEAGRMSTVCLQSYWQVRKARRKGASRDLFQLLSHAWKPYSGPWSFGYRLRLGLADCSSEQLTIRKTEQRSTAGKPMVDLVDPPPGVFLKCWAIVIWVLLAAVLMIRDADREDVCAALPSWPSLKIVVFKPVRASDEGMLQR